jgi:hypothetical protein
MESMRQTLKARGAHEAARMLKQGWNGLLSRLWWMTGAMFLYLRSQFMAVHVDNPNDKHAELGDLEFCMAKSSKKYKQSSRHNARHPATVACLLTQAASFLGVPCSALANDNWPCN